jgi:NMD protein affecting ribosome stability and mRNA decay
MKFKRKTQKLGEIRMFCVKCGVEIQDNSKFCHNCGANVSDGGEQKSPAKLNLDKIIKQDTFYLKKGWFSEAEGVLTLFPNRLNWKSNENVNILLNDVINVVTDAFTMTIKTPSDEYKFRKQMEGVASAILMGLSAGPVAQAGFQQSKSQNLYLDSWRQMIEELRLKDLA